MKIPVFEPDFGEAEIRAVMESMRRGEISGTFGRAIPEFEELNCEYLGVPHAVAVSNGTTALQLAARVAGVKEGDEVLVSASTNIASALAVYYNGAVTVPVDSEAETWNLDLNVLESLISPRTTAIIAVHLFGNPIDMDRLMKIARAHNLVVIEDCAEAHGSEWRSRKVGSFGDFACFSFLSNKVITTGEGGLVTARRDDHAESLRSLKSLAFGSPRFFHPVPGYNFRLSAIQAAMGVVQVSRIEEIVAAKIALYQRYRALLDPIPGIEFASLPENGRHVHWMVAVRIREEFGTSRDELMAHLAKNGIETRTFFCPMNQQPFLREQPGYRPVDCPIADAMWTDGLYLPSTTSLTDSQLSFIAEAILNCPRH